MEGCRQIIVASTGRPSLVTGTCPEFNAVKTYFDVVKSYDCLIRRRRKLRQIVESYECLFKNRKKLRQIVKSHGKRRPGITVIG
jgi:aminoglycoside phosphotransferase family enzyme